MNTIEEVNALLAFTKSPHSVQAELSDDSLDAMYICTVNTSKPKRHVFADLQLATQSSKPKYLKVRLDTAADVSMMSKSVYQQLFDDPQCQKLQPVTINTVMHDCVRRRPVLPQLIFIVSVVDFCSTSRFYIFIVCVDRSGSLSGGAFNQLRLATLNIVLTILY